LCRGDGPVRQAKHLQFQRGAALDPIERDLAIDGLRIEPCPEQQESINTARFFTRWRDSRSFRPGHGVRQLFIRTGRWIVQRQMRRDLRGKSGGGRCHRGRATASGSTVSPARVSQSCRAVRVVMHRGQNLVGQRIAAHGAAAPGLTADDAAFTVRKSLSSGKTARALQARRRRSPASNACWRADHQSRGVIMR